MTEEIYLVYNPAKKEMCKNFFNKFNREFDYAEISTLSPKFLIDSPHPNPLPEGEGRVRVGIKKFILVKF